MAGDSEIELKFLLPPQARAALLAELCRLPVQRIDLAARYLDTPDRRLAREGLAWRMRQEGEQWVQTLKAAGAHPLQRFEHEVAVADANPDPARHAGTPAGERLLQLLRHAHAADVAPGIGVRYQTRVHRISRRLRTRGAVVEVAFDEGRLLAQRRVARICEVEFELVSGPPAALLALAERWRQRFGLVHDPRSKAERGDRLAEGSPHPPLRKALAPTYEPEAGARQAFQAVLDECLAQVAHNAIGLIEGEPGQRAEHVHQMRVGIRRLRSALRCFEGWVAAPPPRLVAPLRELFATLGQVRDAEVLGSGVAAELERAGAPPLALPAAAPGPDAAAVAKSPPTQQLLLAWIGWRTSLADADPGTQGTKDAHAGGPSAAAGVDADTFHRKAAKRLRRWHRRLADDCARFDALDEPALHALRKRIKRQRYAVEFFAPVLRGKATKRYLEALAAVQERMGELHDLLVARDPYRALVAQEPGAWFALGWLAARTQQLRALAHAELEGAVKVEPPKARR